MCNAIMQELKSFHTEFCPMASKDKGKGEEMKIKILILTMVLIFGFVIVPNVDAKAGIPDKVRIGLYYNDEKGGYNNTVANLKLSSSKGVRIYSSGTKGSLLWKYDGSKSITITKDSTSNKRLLVKSEDGSIVLKRDSLLYIVPGANVISVNGSKYRGAIEIKIVNGRDMTVINHVGLEDYLYGVVPCEIQSNSHTEALKAQAVAARTYVLNNMDKHAHLGFNLCARPVCQVYKGYSVERASTNAAVDGTKGKIVTYKGKPATTFYFSSSGGMTENVSNVWGGKFPYLVSVLDQYEGKNSWNYNWNKEFSPIEIEEIMKRRGSDIGRLTSIDVTKRSEAGRVIEMQVKGTKGSETFKNNNCRTVFSLYSQLFDVDMGKGMFMVSSDDNIYSSTTVNKKVVSAYGTAIFTKHAKNLSVIGAGYKGILEGTPNTIKITGKGWGHAVGMSQEGAKGMAVEGFRFDEILRHYYPGTKVE